MPAPPATNSATTSALVRMRLIPGAHKMGQSIQIVSPLLCYNRFVVGIKETRLRPTEEKMLDIVAEATQPSCR